MFQERVFVVPVRVPERVADTVGAATCVLNEMALLDAERLPAASSVSYTHLTLPTKA